MSQTYFAILTAVGEAKLANAAALGTQLQISRMAVGDGGGSLPNPNRNQSALVGEKYRADLNTLQTDPANASQVIAELVIPETTGGWWIREMGLYDAAGDLIAVSNCPPSYKPQMTEGSGRTQVLRMVLIVSSTAAVQLKIDPSVVLATREYVVTTIAAELAKLDSKQSVRVATTAAVSLSGFQTIDGVPLGAGDRVLVKNQGDGAQNGIYVVSSGAWSRATDADASIEVTPGMLVPVEQGVSNADSVWQLVTDFPISLGATALSFEVASGPTGLAAGTYRSVTVDKRGRVVGGTNPTTLAGYGITDALKIGDHGVGGNIKTFTGNIDDAATVPLGWCFVAVANGTTGTVPSNYGILKTVGFRNDQMLQIFSVADGVPNTTTAKFYRTGMPGRVGGSWGPWVEIAKRATTLEGYGITDAVKRGEYGIGNTGALPVVEGFNNLVTGGLFHARGADRPIPAEVSEASSWYVLVEVIAANAVKQTATLFGPSPRSFVRASHNGAWLGWREVITSANAASKIDAETGTSTVGWMSPLRVFEALRSVAASATEVLRGVLRVGTQAEVNAGTLDDVAVTPKKLRAGLSSSFGATGHIALPEFLGGFAMCWGKITNSGNGTSYTFSRAFSELYGVMVTSDGTVTTSLELLQAGSLTTTGFTALGAIINPQAASNVPGWYIAYGK